MTFSRKLDEAYVSCDDIFKKIRRSLCLCYPQILWITLWKTMKNKANCSKMLIITKLSKKYTVFYIYY